MAKTKGFLDKLSDNAKANQQNRVLNHSQGTYFGNKQASSQGRKRTREEIIRDMNEARAKGDLNRVKELKAKLRGSEPDVSVKQQESNNSKLAVQNNQNNQSNQNKQTNQTNQNNQSSQINRNYYTDYYGRDIHKNGAIPFQGKKNEDEPSEEPKRSGFNFSNGFYPDLFGRRFGRGNELDIQAEKARGMSENAQNEAATHGMEAQVHTRISEQNPVDAAVRKASVQNDQQQRANINSNFMKGNRQVGLVRMNNAADIKYEQQRGDTERLHGETQRQKELNSQATADMMANDEKQLRQKAGDYDSDLNNSWKLSMGNGSSLEDQPKENPEKKDENKEQNTTQPQAEEQKQQTEKIVGNPHTVFNYLTYGNDKSSKNYNGALLTDDDRKLLDQLSKKFGKQLVPFTEQDVASVGGFNAGEGALQPIMKQKYPEFYDWYNTESQRGLDTKGQKNIGKGTSREELNRMSSEMEVPAYACGTDNAKPGYALVGEKGPELVKMNGGEEVIPINEDNVDLVLSDLRCKMIIDLLENGHGMTEDDFLFLAQKQGGKFNHNGRDYDFFNDDDWKDDEDDSVLGAYADHIKNYVYTYKNEAKSIDPSIDLNEEHIGPMAQDIEKVNPACVKETPEGVKTVDTARLSMMNAGAIGDLAREMGEIKILLQEILNG